MTSIVEKIDWDNQEVDARIRAAWRIIFEARRKRLAAEAVKQEAQKAAGELKAS